MARLLRQAGHEVFTPTLSGQGERAHLLSPEHNIDTYVRDITAELQTRDLYDVVLVAHSFSGYPVTVAADLEANRISRLVYLDAAVPADGQSNAQASPKALEGWIKAVEPDGWRVPPMPVEVLEVNEADREMVRARLTPMPITPFLQRISLTGAIETIPHREFVLATGWAANPYRAQFEHLSTQPGWTVTQVATGHEVMLDDPEWVADYLSKAAPASL